MATEAQRDAMLKRIAKNKAPALFETSDEFVGVFEQYIEDIKGDKSNVPSYTNFASWLGDLSPSSIYYFFKNHPDARDRTAELMADALVEGAILGVYRDAPTIFALKNRCNWTDKKESISKHEVSDIATPDETRANVKAILKSLGYDNRNRPRAESREKLAEMDDRIIQLAEAKAASNGLLHE